jgi:membrane-bound lytic murein transglycosylase C
VLHNFISCRSGFRRFAACVAVLLVVNLSASCATTKVVATNIQRVANGQAVDQKEIGHAVAADTTDMEAGLQQLRSKFQEAVAQLKANVQKRWGQDDAKVADRTVYVKYTQGYKSRVVTDFDHGFMTVETLDEKDPDGSLKTAIIAALLTSNDPSSVDIFGDKDVTLDAARRPYLYGLVHDNQGKSVRTREQAERFADYLVAQKAQTRALNSLQGPTQGGKAARFVKVAMVKNFEAKGADRYRASVDKYAAQYHVSSSLVLAIIRTESNFNPFAVSNAPAYGLMQLVPTSGGRAAMRRARGIDQTPTPEYLYDPEHNIELGAAYLAVLNNGEFHTIDNQNSRDYCVIAAYNTGPRNVTRSFGSDRNAALNSINGLEPIVLFERLRTNLPSEETRQYVVKVTGYRKLFVGTAAEPITAMQ